MSPESEPKFFDRHLPPRSFRRVMTVSTFCLTAAIGALHFEVSRLQATQEEGINSVKTEVANQGESMQVPLVEGVNEAKDKIDEATGELGICRQVAEELGIDIQEPGESPDQVTDQNETSNEEQVASGNPTTTTVNP